MIKKIIQCADLHIRRFQRFDEYNEQFEKFIDKCKVEFDGYEFDERRILICGDLLHNKNEISNEQYVFASSFLRKLSEISKVLVYCGNHDILVNNNSRIDSLTGLFETAKFDNVYYLDAILSYRSGCLVDDNITWVLYSIHENYRKPEIESVEGNLVVGLYHGVVIGAQLNNGSVMDCGLSGDIFEGCDVCMLGDIHKYQEFNRGDCLCVYSGSLIQQNFGETITQHGFVSWDIENKAHSFIDLPTNYGLYDFQISSIDDIDNDTEILINF